MPKVWYEFVPEFVRNILPHLFSTAGLGAGRPRGYVEEGAVRSEVNAVVQRGAAVIESGAVMVSNCGAVLVAVLLVLASLPDPGGNLRFVLECVFRLISLFMILAAAVAIFCIFSGNKEEASDVTETTNSDEPSDEAETTNLEAPSDVAETTNSDQPSDEAETTNSEAPSDVGVATKFTRVIMIGSPGVGKSTMLNSLLGSKAFQETLTQSCSSVTQVDGMVCIDTPGLSDEKGPREIIRAIHENASAGNLKLIAKINQQQRQQQHFQPPAQEQGYRFGDITRGIVAKGKKADGRSQDSGYKFGDFTRGLLSIFI